MKNNVLEAIVAEIAEVSNVLPLEFSLTLPEEQWNRLWEEGIVNQDTGKPFVQRFTRLRFPIGGFTVYVSQEDLTPRVKAYVSVH